jgi:hypothetical protein
MQDLADFRNEFLFDITSRAIADGLFKEQEFARVVAADLEETGVLEGSGFNSCFPKVEKYNVDGYSENFDEASIDLIAIAFSGEPQPSAFTRTEADTVFKRMKNFFEQALTGRLHPQLDVTSPCHGLAYSIWENRHNLAKVRLFIFTDRELSNRFGEMEKETAGNITFEFHIWHIRRILDNRQSPGGREPILINIKEMNGTPLSCLPASTDAAGYRSFLVVMPGTLLANLYDRYGARLLEQNVRGFLQSKGKINKGIRNTIRSTPSMFFAYNNGITATAREVKLNAAGTAIEELLDLQIVNGGQTTASLFHTRRQEKDAVDLGRVSVQMKLVETPGSEGEDLVRNISAYANTQNKVSASDLFANHPFHVRMQDSSRTTLAPAKSGSQRESKWFYERARGQYSDELLKCRTDAEKKKFQLDYPKSQLFTKTDLAKYENVWEGKPTTVHFGAQKNFISFAERIGQVWDENPDSINPFYFKQAVVRGIIFEDLVKALSRHPEYKNFPTNIGAYAISLLAEYCRTRKLSINVEQIWSLQELPKPFMEGLMILADITGKIILNPPQDSTQNRTEWAKKEACWSLIKARVADLDQVLPESFKEQLIDQVEVKSTKRQAKDIQRVDNGIGAQTLVVTLGVSFWRKLQVACPGRGIIFTEKEQGVLASACKPGYLPSAAQSAILLTMLKRCQEEGIINEQNIFV